MFKPAGFNAIALMYNSSDNNLERSDNTMHKDKIAAWLDIFGTATSITGNKGIHIDMIDSFIKEYLAKKIEKENDEQIAIKAYEDDPSLFGTSGVRGVFPEQPIPFDQALRFFYERNILSIPLAYFIARSLAKIILDRSTGRKVNLFHDPRESAPPILLSLALGLIQQGAEAHYCGILPTTAVGIYPGELNIVITASHNPARYNGIKVFIGNQPISVSLEREIDQQVLAHIELARQGKRLSAGREIDEIALDEIKINAQDAKERYNQELKGYLVELFPDDDRPFAGKLIPMDLSCGSAAMRASDNGSVIDAMPVVSLFLEAGATLVVYGGIIDPAMVNYCCGAAYLYGESEHELSGEEIFAFSRGVAGYSKQGRIVIFPPDGDLAKYPAGTCLTIEPCKGQSSIGFTEGQMEANDELRDMITQKLSKLELLPAVAFDGDADRLIITSPMLCQRPVPVIDGDAILKLLVSYCAADDLSHAVYTYESGLSLEKACEAENARRSKAGKTPLQYQAVKIGDRSLMEYLKDNQADAAVGAEPSGHIIFTQGGRLNFLRIIDSPVYTYLRVLRLLADVGLSLDEAIRRLDARIAEVFCARKPDAFADGGITLKEKRLLRLWDDNGNITGYAGSFIPWMVMEFLDSYVKSFYAKRQGDVMLCFAPAVGEVLNGLTLDMALQTSRESDFELTTALITDSMQNILQEIPVVLMVTDKGYLGPDVIKLSFYQKNPDGSLLKIGEVVNRNSGTKPKNSAYIKVWNYSYATGITITDDHLIEMVSRLATSRARFTDNYIRHKRKSKP